MSLRKSHQPTTKAKGCVKRRAGRSLYPKGINRPGFRAVDRAAKPARHRVEPKRPAATRLLSWGRSCHPKEGIARREAVGLL